MERGIDMPKGNFLSFLYCRRNFLMLLYWHGALRHCLRKPLGRNRVCSPTGSVELTLDVIQVLLMVIIAPPSGSPKEKASNP